MPDPTALEMESQARARGPLHDFERMETPRRIRMLVCARCATWVSPLTAITSPCLKDGTPHHFEGRWYRLEEPDPPQVALERLQPRTEVVW